MEGCIATSKAQTKLLDILRPQAPARRELPEFEYTVQGPDGHMVKAIVRATSVTEAVQILHDMNVMVVNLRPVKTGVALPPFVRRRAKAPAVIRFTRCLAVMFNAGLPVIRALEVLARQEPDKVLQQAVRDVAHHMETGASFTQAFGVHPQAFSRLYVSLLKVGETTGGMSKVLEQLAAFLERDYQTVSKATAALRYPIFVFTTALLLVAALFTCVLPPLLATCVSLAGPGAVLPLPTRILSVLLHLANNPFMQVFLLAAIGGTAWFVKAWRSRPEGQYRFDRLLLAIPVVGDMLQQILLSRFCRSWGLMVEAGISIHSSLDVLGRYLDNAYFKEDVVKVLADDLMAGVSLRDSATMIPFFPRLVPNLLGVGEATGDVGHMLLVLAGYYEEQVERAIDTVLSMIEPVMIGLMGVLVCFVLLAVFLPLYQVVSSLGH